MTNNQPVDISCHPFASGFFDALVAAITQASGVPWLVAALPDAPAPDQEADPFQITLTADGNVAGQFLFELSRAEATVLAARCLRRSGDEFAEEQSQALVELIATAAASCCAALAQKYGVFTLKAAITAAVPSARTNPMEITVADNEARVTLRLYLSAGLLDSLSAVADVSESSSESRTTDQRNLDLVLDVELSVTLRFGQRQLTLREVLELTSGSVIELDRQVEEPVDLLLEGRVIARGEAVVIDGNYGLRVTEVPRPITVSELR